MKKTLKRALWATAFFPAIAQAAYVGPPSGSAGVVEREIQQEYFDAQEIDPYKEVPLLEVDIPEQQLELADDVAIDITSIELKGNCIFSTCTLQPLLCAYENRQLYLKDIHELCREIQCFYLRNGYFLARVFPPVQEIENGVLTLEVVEGCLGEISVQGNCAYKTDFICSYFSRFQSCAINHKEFIRALLLLNENEDLNAGAVFTKGKTYGTADLIIRVCDSYPIHLYLNTNNYGSESTSQQRTGGRFDFVNLLMNGDKFSIAQVNGSPIDSLTFTEGRYRIPLNRRGTHLQASYLYSDHTVSDYYDLGMGGTSNIAAGRLSQALARTRCLSTDLYFHFDYKQIKNRALGHTNSYDKLRNAGAGFLFDWLDGFQGRNKGDLHVVAGIPDFLGGLDSVDSACSRQGGGGKYWIFTADYTRIQPLFPDTYLLIQLAGQYSSYKLPLAEQIFVGGAETTRGYPVASSLGDKGYNGTIELRTAIPFLRCYKAPFTCRRWGEVVQLVFFYDRGQTWLNGGSTPNQKDSVALNGAGLGFRVYGPWKFEWSFDVGFPLTKTEKTSDSVFYFKVSWNPF